MMPYSSRDEITTAIQRVAQKSLNGELPLRFVYIHIIHPHVFPHIFPSNITEEDISAELFTTKGGNNPVEILIRTSGARRFSDFLLWQVCYRGSDICTTHVSSVL